MGFKDAVNTEQLLLVDFFTTWCAPCKKVPPILKKVKENYNDVVEIHKIDVDMHKKVAEKYQIRNVPTVMLIRKNKVLWKKVGVATFDEIEKAIEQFS